MVDDLRIAITPVQPLEDEGHLIGRLLDGGHFNVAHLRHPDITAREMAAIIEDVPQRWHKALHLHGHFDLINEYNLGGIHLNRRCPTKPAGYTGTLSVSCHSIEDVEHCEREGLQYVTLSPIFDSISKPGYRSAFSEAELRILDRFKIKVVALGGVHPTNITMLQPYNFSGYAMLGAVPWGK